MLRGAWIFRPIRSIDSLWMESLCREPLLDCSRLPSRRYTSAVLRAPFVAVVALLRCRLLAVVCFRPEVFSSSRARRCHFRNFTVVVVAVCTVVVAVGRCCFIAGNAVASLCCCLSMVVCRCPIVLQSLCRCRCHRCLVLSLPFEIMPLVVLVVVLRTLQSMV
jgi:hypothetical protein